MADSLRIQGGNPASVAMVNTVSLNYPIIPVVTAASAYTAGMCVGGKIAMDVIRSGGKTAIMHSLHIIDKSNTKPSLTALIFGANPSEATITDHAVFHYNGAHYKQVRVVPIPGADGWTTLDGIAMCDIVLYGRPVGIINNTDTGLYMVLVCGTATFPTFVSTSDLLISPGFYLD